MNIDDILIKHLKENQAYLSSNERFAVKAAIKEICIELLEKAADNGKVKVVFANETEEDILGLEYHQLPDRWIFVEKESITNTINQIQGL